jgi:ketosteroid isomerase-like protein
MDVVRAVFAAFAQRDLERVLAHVHADVEFEAVTADEVGRTEPYRGHEGLVEYFRDVGAVWEELRLTPDEFREDDGTILVTGRVHARSPSRVVSGSTGWIWRVRDGKVAYVRVYPSAGEAIAAFNG